jgi:hypothetical protein
MALYKRRRIWWMSFSVNHKQYQKSTGTSNYKLARKIYNIVKRKIALLQWNNKFIELNPYCQTSDQQELREDKQIINNNN